MLLQSNSAASLRQAENQLPLPCFCDSALPAADFDLALVRPSRSVDDAFFAAFVRVFFRVPVCESALPAADFDFDDVERLRITEDDFFATLLLVFLLVFLLDFFVDAMRCLASRGYGRRCNRCARS